MLPSSVANPCRLHCIAPIITRRTELLCSAWRAVLKFWERQRAIQPHRTARPSASSSRLSPSNPDENGGAFVKQIADVSGMSAEARAAVRQPQWQRRRRVAGADAGPHQEDLQEAEGPGRRCPPARGYPEVWSQG